MMTMVMLTQQHYCAIDTTPTLYLSAQGLFQRSALVNFYATFPDHTNS
jgi:hypothetical protein